MDGTAASHHYLVRSEWDIGGIMEDLKLAHDDVVANAFADVLGREIGHFDDFLELLDANFDRELAAQKVVAQLEEYYGFAVTTKE